MFEVNLTDEAREQLFNLDKNSVKKAVKDYKKFEVYGDKGVNSRPLGLGLFEIKTDNIRSIYSYENNKIIIVGVVFMKKTQKTPKAMIEQAIKNIENERSKI